MRMRKILAATAAVVMVAGGVTMAVAPAASAANIGLVADCSGNSGPIVLPLEASPGDVITITSSNCTRVQIDGPGLDPATYFSSYPTEGAAPPLVFVVASDAPIGETRGDFNFGAQRAGDATAMLWHLTIVAGPEPGAEGSTIPSWVQAYGRAGADATCLDGWNPSWQSWAEPVTGGWVCTRSIPSLG